MPIAPAKPSRAVLAAIAAFACTADVFAYTTSGTTYATDGSQADVNAALNAAPDGSIVTVPAGTFTWGDGGTRMFVTKAITLTGAGTAQTFIALSATGPTGQNALINLTAFGAVVKDLTIDGNAGTPVTAFSAGGANGWRISNITYAPVAGVVAYFCLVNGTYGLIDSCNITGAGGTNELIFARGPTDSWQKPSSLGGADNVFIEDCVFNGPGYVCDANANARVVVRFCTINGQMKIDGHGFASNRPRGVRHMEIYDNRWTAPATSSWPAIEIRGGTGMTFDNVSDDWNAGAIWPDFYLTDYGCTGLWSNFNKTYQTPINYPIKDQVGVGMDVNSSENSGGSEPYYLWNNTAGPSHVDWTLHWKTIPSGAITLYQTQEANSSATFTMQDDIIKADRDYFKQTVGATFDGSSGVGRGTKAQMQAITPTKTGVGFWVTDEGSWNTKLSANTSGQLYTWNGSGWVLKYTPYTYPNPERAPTPPSNLQISSP